MRGGTPKVTVSAAAALASSLLAGDPGLVASPARASPWNAPAGTGFLSLDAEGTGGAAYFDGKGVLTPTRSYGKTEASAYVEYGLTDSLMFVARPSFDLVSLGAPGGGTYRGLGAASVGAQYQALVFGPAALAVQGSVSRPGTISRADPAEIGNTAREADLRALGGLSFALGPYRAFLDVQQAYRFRSGGAAPQWHSDVTVGIRPTPRLLLMALSVTVLPLGAGTPWFPSARASKVGVEAVYGLTAAWSVTLRATTTVYGRDALRERGLAAGLWYRF